MLKMIYSPSHWSLFCLAFFPLLLIFILTLGYLAHTHIHTITISPLSTHHLAAKKKEEQCHDYIHTQDHLNDNDKQ